MLLARAGAGQAVHLLQQVVRGHGYPISLPHRRLWLVGARYRAADGRTAGPCGRRAAAVPTAVNTVTSFPPGQGLPWPPQLPG